jgi:hypothetical protein
MQSLQMWALQGLQIVTEGANSDHPGNFWTALPTIMWVVLALVILVLFFTKFSDLLSSLIWRVRCGSPVKLGTFEFGATYVSPNGDISKAAGSLETLQDKDGLRSNDRNQRYKTNRGLFIVHRLAISKEPKQLYDIEIYLIPHKDATLACVQYVDYYFGHYWGDKIFRSHDRARGFSISTSAYGPFVATAKVFFSDDQSCVVSRYIDFEMGPAGTQPLVSTESSPAV